MPSPDQPSFLNLHATTLSLMADSATTNQALRFVLVALEQHLPERHAVTHAGAVLMLPSVEHEIMRLQASVDVLAAVVPSLPAGSPLTQITNATQALIKQLGSAVEVDKAMRERAKATIAAAHQRAGIATAGDR